MRPNFRRDAFSFEDDKFFPYSFAYAWSVLTPHIDADWAWGLYRAMIRYEEPWRFYHSRAHVIALLRIIKKCVSIKQFEKFSDVEVAQLILMCLYHDIIYVPGAKGNELLSARYFADTAEANGASIDLVAPVIRGITASKNHFVRDPSLSRVEELFLDADLSILATDNWETYLDYVSGVRSEYQEVGVSAEDFVTGRKLFLRHALTHVNGGKIFHTPEFDSMNEQAMTNITRELAMCEEEG